MRCVFKLTLILALETAAKCRKKENEIKTLSAYKAKNRGTHIERWRERAMEWMREKEAVIITLIVGKKAEEKLDIFNKSFVCAPESGCYRT